MTLLCRCGSAALARAEPGMTKEKAARAGASGLRCQPYRRPLLQAGVQLKRRAPSNLVALFHQFSSSQFGSSLGLTFRTSAP